MLSSHEADPNMGDAANPLEYSATVDEGVRRPNAHSNSIRASESPFLTGMQNVDSTPHLNRIYSSDTEDSQSVQDNSPSSLDPNSSDIRYNDSSENDLISNFISQDDGQAPSITPLNYSEFSPNTPPHIWLRDRWYTCHSFEEAVMSLRPNSAACLLALMAMCNLGSLFFHSYTALWWLSKGNFATDFVSCGGELVCWLSTIIVFGPDGVIGSQSLTGHIVWAWLIAQVVIGFLKLCFRFHTKRLCIRFIRSPNGQRQSNQNQEEIGNIMHSISFRVHVGLGRTAQVLAVMGYLFYFYLEQRHYRENPERSFLDVDQFTSTQILLDVCCANVVVSFFRGGVALYVLHYYAFQDQMERTNPSKAKIGLSQFELYQLMKTITCKKAALKKKNDDYDEKIKDAQCAICLDCIEDDENMAILPCDGRHMFHAACIKTWLSKRDSCPLCQHSLRPMTQQYYHWD